MDKYRDLNAMGQSLKSKAPNIHYPVYAMKANKKYSHQDYYLIKSRIAQKQ
jgi:hypothetical protein